MKTCQSCLEEENEEDIDSDIIDDDLDDADDDLEDLALVEEEGEEEEL